MDSRQYFSHVLILSENEMHSRRDKRSINSFDPAKVTLLSRACDAFDFLAHEHVDLILCDYELADMSGVRFMNLLSQNMNLGHIPVVMVTTENRKQKVLDCISAGCTGYILRPYSEETFSNHIRMAMNLETFAEIERIQLEEAKSMVVSGDFDEALEAFEEIISIQDEAQKYYDMGYQHLMKRKYGKAIVAFKKAVKINNLFAEAYKGMADAYKGKGEMDSYKNFLQKAANIHAQFDRLEQTKELFIEILKVESDAPNPFNTLGVKLRKEGDYIGALHAYDQALKLSPDDENIYYNVAKAYYYMGDVEKSLDNVVDSLKRNGLFAEARGLYTKITGKQWKGRGKVEVGQANGGSSVVDD